MKALVISMRLTVISKIQPLGKSLKWSNRETAGQVNGRMCRQLSDFAAEAAAGVSVLGRAVT